MSPERTHPHWAGFVPSKADPCKKTLKEEYFDYGGMLCYPILHLIGFQSNFTDTINTMEVPGPVVNMNLYIMNQMLLS